MPFDVEEAGVGDVETQRRVADGAVALFSPEGIFGVCINHEAGANHASGF